MQTTADAKNMQSISDTIAILRKDVPLLEEILNAHEQVLLALQRYKDSLQTIPSLNNDNLNEELFTSGVSLWNMQVFGFEEEELMDSVRNLLPELKRNLPLLSESLAGIERFILENKPEMKVWVNEFMRENSEFFRGLSADVHVPEEVLYLFISRIIRPLAERYAEKARELISGLTWKKGYCPVCSGFPEIGYIIGNEGQRRLKCSICGHDWRSMRTVCPFCESEEQKDVEIFFIEGREFERAESCSRCRRFLPCADIRKRLGTFVPDAVLPAFLPLEMLMREKGFMSMAHSNLTSGLNTRSA